MSYIDTLLRKAEDDLLIAKQLLNCNPPFLDGSAFHIQQSIEKYLKAFLLKNNISPIKTHNLIMLMKLCSDVNPDFSSLLTPILVRINDFAVAA